MSEEIEKFTTADIPTPSEEKGSILIVKDELPDKSGYKFSFVETKNGLLRRVLSSGKPQKGDRIFSSADAWNNAHYWDAHEEQAIPFFYASNAGAALVDSLGVDWLRENITNPDSWQGERIGEGSESKVYKATFGERDCVVKLPNTDAIERLNKYDLVGASYSPPDYLRKFGKTELVGRILKGVEDEFTTFRLAAPVKEYLAGKGFSVEEYRKGDSSETVIDFIVSGDDNETLYGFDKYHWNDWVERFSREVKRLTDIFFVVGVERGSPFAGVDLSNRGKGELSQNWLIERVDEQTGLPILVVIDQEVTPTLFRGGANDFQEAMAEAQYAELVEKYKEDPVLHYMREYKLS